MIFENPISVINSSNLIWFSHTRIWRKSHITRLNYNNRHTKWPNCCVHKSRLITAQIKTAFSIYFGLLKLVRMCNCKLVFSLKNITQNIVCFFFSLHHWYVNTYHYTKGFQLEKKMQNKWLVVRINESNKPNFSLQTKFYSSSRLMLRNCYEYEWILRGRILRLIIIK